ncbi:citrate synthase [Povalibacter uvarum]|uniref:citrate synthase (unknown stereospecificity) n=1 Tax=Povalibacter uvarum TaxID=732238 RepID=A0A841HNJ3_9GAMM|nr:citryl-CoA lyase [Povalibacter uvarum]MBB6093515.1 citrate synthase [Povalibacter uvarum]
MSDAQSLLDSAKAWWSTDIIDIHPGKIGIRGYPIQDLIGKLTFPQMIWLMVRGDVPSKQQAQLLEAALVASVDHGPHAPSIAIARMAVTCGVDLNNAMASGINVLGDIHGGPGQQCMELYEQIAAAHDGTRELADVADDVLGGFIGAHGKIVPGFGHRFHPIDPRVEPLLGLVANAASQQVVSGHYAAIGRAVEAALRRRTNKPIPMNIDGVTAVIFCELGFPPPMGRGLFILSRSVGILAHAWEEMQNQHRIKGPMPKEIPYTYTGPRDRKLSDQ